jgi:hypothetical protein
MNGDVLGHIGQSPYMSARADLDPYAQTMTGGRMADPRRLRGEVDGMMEAVTGALVDRFGAGMRGLWAKGSAVKPWDSAIDYVPELSDVDIHYQADDRTAALLCDLDTGLAIHADIERRFASSFPAPLHVPRAQFVPTSAVEALPGYVPTPASAVRNLHGPAWVGPDAVDEAAARRTDANALVRAADPRALDQAVLDLIERPGHHLYVGLRGLGWRVSQTGSRVLSVLGVDFETAWSANRTVVVRLLTERGQDQLAGHLVTYYEAAWDAFLSGWQDTGASRAAFGAAVRALRLGASIGAGAGGGTTG